MRYYTGVGSRQTPIAVQKMMTSIAEHLVNLRFTLRSGGAIGADQAFERGAKEKEIYYATDTTEAAEQIASKIHPNWGACDRLSRGYHGRNVLQVLGRDLHTPSEFVVCWTKEGKAVGGTRTAIMVAAENGIPVFNLAKPEILPQLETFLNTL